MGAVDDFGMGESTAVDADSFDNGFEMPMPFHGDDDNNNNNDDDDDDDDDDNGFDEKTTPVLGQDAFADSTANNGMDAPSAPEAPIPTRPATDPTSSPFAATQLALPAAPTTLPHPSSPPTAPKRTHRPGLTLLTVRQTRSGPPIQPETPLTPQSLAFSDRMREKINRIIREAYAEGMKGGAIGATMRDMEGAFRMGVAF